MEDISIDLPPRVQVFLNAQKSPMRRSYASKWTRFSIQAAQAGHAPETVPLSFVFSYLLDVVDSGLAFSVKVHLAAISAFHLPVEGSMVFSHRFSHIFLKGLIRLHPPVKLIVPSWSLSLVLAKLMSKPFDPLATVDLRLSSWQTAFLVAITSAKHSSELGVFRHYAPFTVFHKDKVSFVRTLPSFQECYLLSLSTRPWFYLHFSLAFRMTSTCNSTCWTSGVPWHSTLNIPVPFKRTLTVL